jgi:hypothetical protein
MLPSSILTLIKLIFLFSYFLKNQNKDTNNINDIIDEIQKSLIDHSSNELWASELSNVSIYKLNPHQAIEK